MMHQVATAALLVSLAAAGVQDSVRPTQTKRSEHQDLFEAWKKNYAKTEEVEAKQRAKLLTEGWVQGKTQLPLGTGNVTPGVYRIVDEEKGIVCYVMYLKTRTRQDAQGMSCHSL